MKVTIEQNRKCYYGDQEVHLLTMSTSWSNDPEQSTDCFDLPIELQHCTLTITKTRCQDQEYFVKVEESHVLDTPSPSLHRCHNLIKAHLKLILTKERSGRKGGSRRLPRDSDVLLGPRCHLARGAEALPLCDG